LDKIIEDMQDRIAKERARDEEQSRDRSKGDLVKFYDEAQIEGLS
jgi:hypothetical protein